MSDKDKTKDINQPDSSRRKFMLATALSATTLATGLNIPQASAAAKNTKRIGNKRVAILVDTETHMMPALAREMVRRGHNLVIGNAAKGLADELKKMGAEVEEVRGRLDLTKASSVQKLVKAAKKRFGGVDSACIRTGSHTTGTIMDITTADAQSLYEGNMLSTIYALQALLKPMLAQGSGQIVINTSATGLRPSAAAAMYSACRAGANMLMRSAAITAAPKGVTINATGTYAMNYPGFLDDIGWEDPKVQKAVLEDLPLHRLVEPEQAAHFVATLIDGVGTAQTGQFFSIDNGWAFQ
ncbi:MAG: SDR family NAD(P)-dependent oxidoreductase [Gammaproteobacteria bacterium]